MEQQHDSWGKRLFDHWSRLMQTYGLSHTEMLIVTQTFRENNFYTEHEAMREVMGEPQADYLKPFFPTITEDDVRKALGSLIERKILCPTVVDLRGRNMAGFSLTDEGLSIAQRLEREYARTPRP